MNEKIWYDMFKGYIRNYESIIDLEECGILDRDGEQYQELIKALQYDRDQYYKGYRDGKGEIVHCKDCQNYSERHFQNGETYGWICDIFHMGMKPDDYCSRGVKK